MIVHRRQIDMYPSGVPVVIRLSQYDSDFSLEFTLYSSDGEFTIESGTTAMIRGTKTDGNGYDADCAIDITNKKVTVTGAAQMTAVRGRNIYELVLRKSGKDVSTANFVLLVEPAAMDADTITSETVLKELNAIIEGAAAATDAAERAEEAATHLTIDDTLTQAGQAADAKKTGDEITSLKSDLDNIVPGLSEDAKAALLSCFAHVVWLDEHGQNYYDALEDALYENDHIIYKLPSPLVLDGATGGLLTDCDAFANATEMESGLSVLVDFTENIDFDVAAAASNPLIVFRSVEAGDSSPFSYSVYKSANASNVVHQINFMGYRTIYRTPRSSSGHNRLKMALSYKPGDALYKIKYTCNFSELAVFENNGTFSFRNSPRKMNIGTEGSAVAKGTMNSVEILNYAMSEAELSSWVTSA